MLSKVKVGETVAILGFTGMRLSDLKVTGVTKTHIKVAKADGSEMIFDKKTGKQTNVPVEKEKFANKAVLLEDAPERTPRGAKKKAEKPAKKAPKPVAVVEDEDEDDEEEEEPAPKKKPAKKAAAPAKKPAKKAAVVEEEDWEDDEDDEDEEEWEDEEE